MGARQQVRRGESARVLAERYGVTARAVRRAYAEPRTDYLARAAARRSQALELRTQGLKLREIAEVMGCSIGTVGSLLHDARKLAATEAAEQLQQSA